jgi:Type II secretion system (T2SS), protein M subtype b
MIHRLPLRLRQLLAVTLLLLTLAATAALTVVPFMSQLADSQYKLERERMVLGGLQAKTSDTSLAKQLELDARAPKATGLFIDGESEPIRLASLQSRLMDIINAQSVKPRTTRNLPTRERNTMKLVGVQLQLTATIDQLQKILLEIEAHRPVLLVDALHLTPSSSVGSEDDRGILEARIDVVAIEARPETRPKSP